MFNSPAISEKAGDTFGYSISIPVQISGLNGKFEDASKVTSDLKLLFCDALCIFMDDVFRNKSMKAFSGFASTGNTASAVKEEEKKLPLEEEGYQLAKLVTMNDKETITVLISDFYKLCESHKVLKINNQLLTYDIATMLAWQDRRELFLRFCGFFFKTSNGSCKF